MVLRAFDSHLGVNDCYLKSDLIRFREDGGGAVYEEFELREELSETKEL